MAFNFEKALRDGYTPQQITNYLTSQGRETEAQQKFGVDPSLTTLNAKGIILKKHDVTSRPLPFVNNYFDVVTMLAVFEHIEDSSISPP